MRKRNGRFYLILIGILICLFGTNKIAAQNASFEFWPETDIWYRFSPSWRLSSFIAIAKYKETQYRDLNFTLQADYAWGKTKKTLYKRLVDDNKAHEIKGWLARGGYMGGWGLGENVGSYLEDMLFAEIHKRVPLKNDFLFSQRFRIDTRWLGEDSNFSYRLRYRFILEKEFTFDKSFVVPYVNIEPSWDSRYQTLNRVRVICGATAFKGKVFAYEGNLTYQYDSYYETTNLYAVNLILHIFFEKK